MAWTDQGSIKGPKGDQGPAADTSTLVPQSDVAVPATGGKIVRRGTSGQVTVPPTPQTTTDAVSKGYVDGNFVTGSFTVVTSTTRPTSAPANQITLVVP